MDHIEFIFIWEQCITVLWMCDVGGPYVERRRLVSEQVCFRSASGIVLTVNLS